MVFAHIPRAEPRLLEGMRLFNEGQFFGSHEVWESLWHDVVGPERELLQGLIQVAAAYYHLSRGNRAGAGYLYRRARPRLSKWAPQHAGLDVGDFLARVDRQFAE